MLPLDDLSLDQAIALYYEKHYLMRQGDVIKLLQMKAQYPIIFDEAKDAELRKIIEDAKAFSQTPCYKELSRQRLKDAILIINNIEQELKE